MRKCISYADHPFRGLARTDEAARLQQHLELVCQPDRSQSLWATLRFPPTALGLMFENPLKTMPATSLKLGTRSVKYRRSRFISFLNV
jgi:hypothetical protein